MSAYSIWPCFACLAVLLSLASLRVMHAADSPPSPHPNRISSLDGLRGFLALGVFFHHAAITYLYLLTGRWEPPPSRFYSLLGQVGVAVFFMITGYLFWGKTIKEHGRPDWLRLYVGRIFRIGPLYLFAIGSMLVIVMVKTRFHLNEPFGQLGRDLLPWLMLGFILGPGHDINKYSNTYLVLAGVTWTLRYEWFFYLSLLVTALVARRTYFHLYFAVTALTLAMSDVATIVRAEVAAPVPVCIALFLIGMTCASLERSKMLPKLPNLVSSGLVVALIAIVFGAFRNANMAGPLFFLGLAFLLVISGSNLFGLLTSRAARRLGDVSYGIYLLQGLVLTVVFSFSRIRTFDRASPVEHWIVVLVAAVLLVGVATVTHVLIERPGIEWGKRVIAILPTRWTTATTEGLVGR